MSNFGWFLMMILTTIAGGLTIGTAVEKFKSGQYIRFGFWTMIAISEILLMAKYVFAVW